MSEIVLQVGTRAYKLWSSMRITRSLEALAATFTLQAVEGDAVRIDVGSACEIRLGKSLVMTGWVEERNEQVSSSGHTLRISGRCKTGDLVDCSIEKPCQYRSIAAALLLGQLLKPYGLKLEGTVEATLNHFVLNEGETVHEAMDRIARLAGVWLTSTGEGHVSIVKLPSAISASLTAASVIDADAQSSWKDRHSVIEVRSSRQGDDSSHGSALFSSGSGRDAAILRHRPLCLNYDNVNPKKRAAWEVTVRAARGERLNVTVMGWHAKEGGLWWPGQLIDVTIPSLRIKCSMLLVEVTFSSSDQGTRSELVMSPPNAYKVEPV